MVIWNETAQITEVLPRRNQLSRRGAVPMPGAYAHEQVIVANVDQVIPVFAAANPRPAWNLLDRYLVSAESAEIPALICLTKMDLVEGSPQAEEIEAVASEYRAIGYEVVLTSTVTGRGLDDLKARLHGRLSALIGKSGVGKTSLLNAVEPGLGLRVQAISKATGKGRHTTSTSEIFALGVWAGPSSIHPAFASSACGMWPSMIWPGSFLRCARSWATASSGWTAATTRNRAAPFARPSWMGRSAPTGTRAI